MEILLFTRSYFEHDKSFALQIDNNKHRYREGFNKNQKKKYGIFHTIGRNPPPLQKYGKNIFFNFIYGF